MSFFDAWREHEERLALGLSNEVTVEQVQEIRKNVAVPCPKKACTTCPGDCWFKSFSANKETQP